jgi:sortase (surface protein transpeptidase)
MRSIWSAFCSLLVVASDWQKYKTKKNEHQNKNNQNQNSQNRQAHKEKLLISSTDAAMGSIAESLFGLKYCYCVG